MSIRALKVRSLILSSLAAGSRDASGLITDVDAISGGQLRLRAGTLFAALWRLRADRLITVDREELVDRRIRRYYALTLAGYQTVGQQGMTRTNHSNREDSMGPTLELSRSSRLADAAWPYEIVLDGHVAGKITNRSTSSLEITAGTHTLQLRSLHIINRHLGLASPVATFDASDGNTTKFVCHPQPFVQALYWWIACLVGARTRWIVLEPVAPQRGRGAR